MMVLFLVFFQIGLFSVGGGFSRWSWNRTAG